MRIVFSEYKSDYDHYIFPYAIWAFPEPDDHPSEAFALGFLPSSRDLDRFYMCRHVRVELSQFEPSSENRRIFRKGQGITYRLVERDQFQYNDAWRSFCKSYADAKFGADVMTEERLDALFQAPVCSHLMMYSDAATGQDIGLIVLYMAPPGVAFYYYSFYDLDYANKNLGMYMMTSAVEYAQQQGFDFIYLGSCYSRNALYKTQFSGFQFWNGFTWSNDLKELKYLIHRDAQAVQQHLLETQEYLQDFYPQGISEVIF